ncbi:MAG: hypothetical protein RSC31_07290 [Anaerovoracaceae bacterium]
MKFALPLITAGLIFIISLTTINAGLIAIAAVVPNSFVIGYLYDKFMQQEKNNKGE